MKRIDKNNAIFKTTAYRNDRNRFHIISMNLASKDLLLYSDEHSYVICRGAIGKPTWIWTIDGICSSKMEEAARLIAGFFLTDNPKDRCICKKEFYTFLKETAYPYLNTEDYFEMGTLECHELKTPKDCDGYMDKAKMEDLNVLAQYWFADRQEMNPCASFTVQQAYEDIKAMITKDTLFIWRNNDGKIVCMVNHQITGDQVKLDHVYTPIEERGKGYASNLIHDITKILLEMHLEPLLYTDYNYIPSNQAYKNAGYKSTGALINFSCSKELG